MSQGICTAANKIDVVSKEGTSGSTGLNYSTCVCEMCVREPQDGQDQQVRSVVSAIRDKLFMRGGLDLEPIQEEDEPSESVCVREENESGDETDSKEKSNRVTSQIKRINDKLTAARVDVKKACGFDITDDMIRKLEGASAYVIALCETRSLIGAISVTLLYIQTHTSKSITSSVCDLMDQVFNRSSAEQQADDDPEWLVMMRNLKDNWRDVRKCSMFTELSNLLGLFVVAGMCEASTVTFHIKGFKVFAPKIMDKHATAFDVIDAICETTTFFVEKMYVCYKTRSFLSIFIDDDEGIKLDEQYASLERQWKLVQCGNLESIEGVSVQQFSGNMEDYCNKVKIMLKTMQGMEKRILQGKYSKILQMVNDYVVLQQSAGVREAPFAIELFGESSQGKTTFGDQLTDALLAAGGYDYADKTLRAPYNPEEEFMSTWSSNKLVMQLDDLCNTKSNFVSRPPTQAIIDVCNNQPFVANMGDLDKKGKVLVQPKVVVVSTNKKDLDAALYSNCPYSIQRRMHVVVTVQAKPEFQYQVDGETQGLDSSKVFEHNERLKAQGREPQFDDIWSLTAEVAVKPTRSNETTSATCNPQKRRGNDDGLPSQAYKNVDPMTTVAKYRPLFYTNSYGVTVPMVGVSIKTMIPFLTELFLKHERNQLAIVEAKRKRSDLILCGVDGCTCVRGYCHKHPEEEEDSDDLILHEQDGYEFGNILYAGMDKLWAVTGVKAKLQMQVFGTKAETSVTNCLVKNANNFYKRWDWLTIFPEWMVMDARAQQCLMLLHEQELERQYYVRTIIHALAPVLVKLVFAITFKAPTVLSNFAMMFVMYQCLVEQWNLVETIKYRFCKQLVKRNSVSPMIKGWRDKYAGKIIGAVTIIAGLYLLAKFYKRWMQPTEDQGSLEPKTKEEVEQRDAEKNVWTQVTPRPLPMSETSKTATSDQLKNRVEKNLVYGSIHDENGKTRMVNALFVRSNVLLLPFHYFKETEKLNVTFRKANPEHSGGKFVAKLTKSKSYHIPDTDLCLCYTPTGGSWKDITEWFPQGCVANHEFSLVRRNKEGVIEEARGLGRAEMTGYKNCLFFGIKYETLTINTYKGLCGAVIISRGSGSCITGMHVAGKENTPEGIACSLTQDQLRKGYEAIRSMPATILTGDAVNFETKVLDTNMMEQGGLHAKSPLNFMPENSQVNYHGNCIGSVSPSTDVKNTPISDIVAEETGVMNIYGPPVMWPAWFGWQKCLEQMSTPGIPFDPDLVDVCVEDYLSDLLVIAESELWKDAKPLEYDENMMGMKGLKFMDAIKMSTSIGFPLTGPKRDYITEWVDENGDLKREFLDVINAEIDRCENCYKRGERAFPIAKACKKDEILAKPKCRIFYSNPISMTFLVRKYYLPILRIVQMNPLVSECSVGINCHGPEWQQFHDHVMKFGDGSIIGGDYGNYDQKVPSQLLLAALRIMIDLAKKCNYTDDDIKIMETMAGDLAFPLIAFNGDLIGLMEGSHISGNSLTSVLNGIVGSLNLRCVFFTQYPPDKNGKRLKFRDHVKIMTYGDDNIGTADSKVVPKFTIKNISKMLEEHGQTYTMPDKTSELTDYLDPEEFEFLKRKTVFCPKRGVHVGALVDKSIFKTLHCFMRGKSCPHTEEMACAMNIDTALGEWFNHGEETFNLRVAQMKRIAEKAEITHLCTTLNKTYDERVAEWKEKYLGEYNPFSIIIDYDEQ